MNPKFKLGITMMTASALMFSTVTSFAGTTSTMAAQPIPESVLEQMLAEGLITEAQMEAYLEKIEAANLAALESALADMVTEGTLTQSKADLAYAAIVEDLENAKAEREKMAAMSATELSAYLETIKDTSFTTELDALKTAGTLTTTQYTAIRKLLNLDSDSEVTTKTAVTSTKTTKTSTTTATATTADTETERLAKIKTQLETLVTNGTFTETQADLVYAAIVSDQETMTEEREKISAMTATELATYMDAKKSEASTSALEALKTAGTITSTQYTAVLKFLMPNGISTTGKGTATQASTGTKTSTTKTTATTSQKTRPANIKTTTVTTTTTTSQSSLLATIKTKLATMVTKGTLTQVQADAAYTAIVADQAALTAEVESVSDMTLEELVEYIQNQKTSSKTSSLDALKTSGVLTSAQYNAVKALLSSGQVFEDDLEQSNFEDIDMEQPPEPMPPMGQKQMRQGK